MAEWNYEIFWKEALNQIKGERGEEEFAMWFNLEYLGAAEDEIRIGVPSAFYRDQVKQRYQSVIETTLHNLTGRKINLVFEVKARDTHSRDAAVQDSRTETGGQVQAKPKKKASHSQLKTDYTFEKYIIGENNNFAVNASMAVSRNPGSAYNPLLIYGGVGMGKTHLMQAIGNYIHENSNNRIIYISAESFTNEFIEALKEKSIAAFKNKYRNIDALLIDDIHFLQKKRETQEELFYTFNALHNANKQMVFTCDRPVIELKDFNERLQSRVGQGLNVDLQPPNYETRFAILKKKVEEKKAPIPDDVLDLISKNVSSNVRDLDKALRNLIGYAELMDIRITVEIAQQQLKDVFAAPRLANMSIDIIQRIVAEYFSLVPNDLKGKKRTQNIVYPRQLAMYIAREITEYSTTELGQSFGGRDHTTVMHSCEKIEQLIRSDPTTEPTINNLTRMIKEYSAKS
ncbi:MAG: chromosomal replication initiator protein DnaA [Spirochaetaceae bacterium]|jgi:chromosomal replication initiator protein|nr:chromosomal replication initiator protein DnaA [Spirochaetaceae bacterium]